LAAAAPAFFNLVESSSGGVWIQLRSPDLLRPVGSAKSTGLCDAKHIGGTAANGDAQLVGKGPCVYVRVEDTGRGIDADRLAVIFEPFEQERVSDAARGSG
jgi:signal transduction histidine kinase